MDSIIHGFTVLSKNPLPEMNAEGIYARHNKTGLELYHILNNDEENLFAFAFMTPPKNSCGVAHILEHSVLCGSKHYPVKDPFLTLSKQSVKTFLNAMTSPDKTVYPAASIIKADYFNLMSVYGDAVFFPLLKREIFEQEGHRVELNEEGKPQFSGVVLNEMRGVYGDFETVMERCSRFSLFEGSLYAEDSGGNPCDIVDLTYEDFCDFHKKYYHPSNCMVFLCGNIPTEEQLAFLDKKFLQHFKPADKPARIPAIQPLSAPKYISCSAPAGAEKNTEKISLTVNWLLPESSNTDTLMDALLMQEVLFGHDGALLEKSLLEYEAADDVYLYNGTQGELKHLYFTAGLIDLPKGGEQAAESYIFNCLQKIVHNGIDSSLIDTALHSLEFANREIIRVGGPFSLVLMRRTLRGWLHGCHPETTLRMIPAFERLKERIHGIPHYLEACIRRFLIENKHRTVVSVSPDTRYSARIDAALAEKARQRYDKQRAASNRPETKPEKQVPAAYADADCIPRLSKKDLPPLPPAIPERHETIGSVPLIIHEQPTNDISYIDIAIPVDGLSEEKQYLLLLYSALLTSLGTETKDWAQVSEETAYYTGGISADLLAAGNRIAESGLKTEVYQAGVQNPALKHYADSSLRNRDWLLIRTKLLPEYIEQGLDVLFSVLRNLSFRDTKRIRDTIIQIKNDFDSMPASAGHTLAGLAASAYHTGIKRSENIWFGIPQIRFIRELHKKMETSTGSIEELINRLEAVHKSILQSGMMVKICSTPALTGRITAALTAHLHGCLPPVPRICERHCLALDENRRLTGFPSKLQVGFGSVVLPTAFTADSIYGAIAVVYAQYLETGILWEKIRTEGGAYGVFTYANSIAKTFSFFTYRDPQPMPSVQTIIETLTDSEAFRITDSELEALITGTYSKILQPQAPREKSTAAFFALLNGLTYEMREQTAQGILSCSTEKLHDFSRILREQLPHGTAALIGTEAMCKYKNIPAAPFFQNVYRAEPL